MWTQKKYAAAILCTNTDSRGNSKALSCPLHGNIVKHDFLSYDKKKHHDKGFKNDEYLHLYSLGKRDNGKRDI